MSKYKCPYRIYFRSPTYLESITVEEGYPSDGATFASDIWSEAWWVHDKLCDTGVFDSGKVCTPWMASVVLGEVLKSEGRWFRSFTWKWGTYLLGPRKLGKARIKVRKFIENNWIAFSPDNEE